ncbi:MAG: hypothetical protein WBA89_04390 [Microcoleus sp.]|uniref:hypothetical protein n=1 Tax=Microcoleus sp. TaxID=44472 RepID=UPI003C789F78
MDGASVIVGREAAIQANNGRSHAGNTADSMLVQQAVAAFKLSVKKRSNNERAVAPTARSTYNLNALYQFHKVALDITPPTPPYFGGEWGG